MKKVFLSGLFFLLLMESGLWAQEQQAEPAAPAAEGAAPAEDHVAPSVEDILKEALSLKIRARLFLNEQNVMWQSEVDKLTIPGRSVTINMKNQQAQLAVGFTPYRKTDGGLILVAKSEIWLMEDADAKNVRYFTSMKSIPMEYGEVVYFYPLGKLEDLENPEQPHIEMGISIAPYLMTQESVAAQEMPEGDAGN